MWDVVQTHKSRALVDIHLVYGNDEMYSSYLQCGQSRCGLFGFPHIFFRYYFKIPAEFSETLKIEIPITSTVISFYVYSSSKHD